MARPQPASAFTSSLAAWPGVRSSTLAEREVARLEQPAQDAGGEIRFDPRTQTEQRASGARQRGGHAGTDRDRPLVPARLFPHQRRVLVGRAGDFDLIE